MQRKCALGAQQDSCARAPTGFRQLTPSPTLAICVKKLSQTSYLIEPQISAAEVNR